MIVVSDNSALSGLAELGRLDLLQRLFARVSIPAAVLAECRAAGAPEALRSWAADLPEWIDLEPDPEVLLPETDSLGAGEASAISLAWLHRGDALLVLDERRGRRIADALGLRKTGLLGMLGQAAALGWLDFEVETNALRATGFHLSDNLVEAVRNRLANDRSA
jgi:predicted nucleic acid-binding protein